MQKVLENRCQSCKKSDNIWGKYTSRAISPICIVTAGKDIGNVSNLGNYDNLQRGQNFKLGKNIPNLSNYGNVGNLSFQI